MNWYDWPAIAALATFFIVMQPRRRVSHYVVALVVAFGAGLVVALPTLLVWGVTR